MDYNNGKIYTIRSPTTDKYYIGSTTQLLSRRFSVHKIDKKYCSSKEIINLGNSYIELLENFPCKCKEELNAREYQLIREHKIYLVNIQGVKTEKEKRDGILTQRKEFYEKNKDELLLKKKEQYNQKRDKILEKNKEYYETHREKISAKQRERYNRLKKQSKEINI